MCLISKRRFPQKAKEDIVCFKVLKRGHMVGTTWMTPFRYIPVETNKLLIAKECKTFSIHYPYNKGKGYIHAYAFKQFVRTNSYYERVFKAIIPKGTKYHISRDGTEICAKKMFITNECSY